MKLANTTEEFSEYFDNDLDRIKTLDLQGFKNIDISFYEEHKPFAQYQGEDWQSRADKLLSFAEEKGVHYVQAHLPGGNPLSQDGFDKLLSANIRCINVCGRLGIKNAVIHAGWQADICKDEFYQKNKQYIELLIPALERNNVNLCIENSCKKNLGKFYYFFDGKELREFLDYVSHPLVTACWDTGHANIEGHQYEDIITLGNKLTALHINDNFGDRDTHMMPYMGTLNIDEVMTALTEIGFNGYFTFECSTSVIFDKNWLNKRRVFEKNTRALNPGLELKKKMVSAAFEAGKQILTAYGCCEQTV